MEFYALHVTYLHTTNYKCSHRQVNIQSLYFHCNFNIVAIGRFLISKISQTQFALKLLINVHFVQKLSAI